MAHIIALDQYRSKKAPPGAALDTSPPPRVGSGDIWEKNYATFEGVVAGILTIREILGYHLHYSEEWKHYALSLLEAAFAGGKRRDTQAFMNTVRAFKAYIAEEMNVVTRNDFGIALLVLELMERSTAKANIQDA